MDYNFHWRPVFRKLDQLIAAGWVTMEVAVLAMLVGIVLGLLLALMKMSNSRSLRWMAVGWIEIARNTPALLQLFFFGFGLCPMNEVLAHLTTSTVSMCLIPR